jgi:hypothetical protein
MNELIKAYEEYIEFLVVEINRHVGFLYAHGIECSKETFEKELREKIKEAKDKYEDVKKFIECEM